ncbi:DUF1566 domain-containing protein [Leptospira fluminis]|uniref:DUF1566 domain-containing protein n=1 Tax=Leptospira fluminis TaxID=2484979 RepID=A0A4V3JEE0_9LEPT|nr:DUF1566 domain-containing protein [Leptospira fluminis]TGK17834.1 DUF1566 domain-containing protein [Leptospira fluminis]
MKKGRFGFCAVALRVSAVVLFSGFSSGLLGQTARFAVNSNNASVINDSATKLYWQRCIYPYSYSTTATPAGCQKNSTFPGGVSMAWSSAASYCTQYNKNGITWRVPTIQELKSIVDRSQFAPAMNTLFDPGQASSGTGIPDFFWSTTSYAQNTNNAWTVNFYYGYSYYTSSKSNPAYLRCVSSNSQ